MTPLLLTTLIVLTLGGVAYFTRSRRGPTTTPVITESGATASRRSELSSAPAAEAQSSVGAQAQINALLVKAAQELEEWKAIRIEEIRFGDPQGAHEFYLYGQASLAGALDIQLRIADCAGARDTWRRLEGELRNYALLWDRLRVGPYALLRCVMSLPASENTFTVSRDRVARGRREGEDGGRAQWPSPEELGARLLLGIIDTLVADEEIEAAADLIGLLVENDLATFLAWELTAMHHVAVDHLEHATGAVASIPDERLRAHAMFTVMTDERWRDRDSFLAAARRALFVAEGLNDAGGTNRDGGDVSRWTQRSRQFPEDRTVTSAHLSPKSWLLKWVSVRIGYYGDPEGGIRAARAIPLEEVRDDALLPALLVAHAASGNREMLTKAKAIASRTRYGEHVRRVMLAYGDAGDYRGAESMLELVDDAEERALFSIELQARQLSGDWQVG